MYFSSIEEIWNINIFIFFMQTVYLFSYFFSMVLECNLCFFFFYHGKSKPELINWKHMLCVYFGWYQEILPIVRFSMLRMQLKGIFVFHNEYDTIKNFYHFCCDIRPCKFEINKAWCYSSRCYHCIIDCGVGNWFKIVWNVFL